MKYFGLLIALIAFISCREESAMRQIISEIEQKSDEIQIVKEEPAPKVQEDDYIAFVRATIPSLKQGMTTDQVFTILELDTRFNGIVTSEGGKNDFTFYYELNREIELRLTFDYSKNKSGQLRNFELEKNS